MTARAAGAVPKGHGGGPRLIQYFGPANTYRRISYYQALEPRTYLPPGLLRGRTVLIGYNLQAAADVNTGATDAFETPFTASTGQLTSGSRCRRPSSTISFMTSPSARFPAGSMCSSCSWPP